MRGKKIFTQKRTAGSMPEFPYSAARGAIDVKINELLAIPLHNKNAQIVRPTFNGWLRMDEYEYEFYQDQKVKLPILNKGSSVEVWKKNWTDRRDSVLTEDFEIGLDSLFDGEDWEEVLQNWDLEKWQLWLNTLPTNSIERHHAFLRRISILNPSKEQLSSAQWSKSRNQRRYRPAWNTNNLRSEPLKTLKLQLIDFIANFKLDPKDIQKVNNRYLSFLHQVHGLTNNLQKDLLQKENLSRDILSAFVSQASHGNKLLALEKHPNWSFEQTIDLLNVTSDVVEENSNGYQIFFPPIIDSVPYLQTHWANLNTSQRHMIVNALLNINTDRWKKDLTHEQASVLKFLQSDTSWQKSDWRIVLTKINKSKKQTDLVALKTTLELLSQ